MTTLPVTTNGKTYSYEASAEQLAGLGAIVASINAKVPAKEDGSPGDPTYATDLALLQESIADWVAANPGSSDEVVVAKIGSTLDSWAGLPAPTETVAVTMSDEAKKAALDRVERRPDAVLNPVDAPDLMSARVRALADLCRITDDNLSRQPAETQSAWAQRMAEIAVSRVCSADLDGIPAARAEVAALIEGA